MSKSVKQDILDIIKESDAISRDYKNRLMDKVEIAFNRHREPISEVFWVPIKSISPNSYNPNKMAGPEKRLLLCSMLDHGITQPLVVAPEKNEQYVLIDGYHRWSIIRTNEELRGRLNHNVPVVILNTSNKNQIVATIRHNRARGRYQIGEIGEVVKTLSTSGWSPGKIMDALGMEADEVLRLKQFKGLGELFKDDDYSPSWTWEEIDKHNEPVWEFVNCFLTSLFARHIVGVLVHNHGHALPPPRPAHSFRYVVPRSAPGMAHNNFNHKSPNRLNIYRYDFCTKKPK